jgi:hypothetical protein
MTVNTADAEAFRRSHRTRSGRSTRRSIPNCGTRSSRPRCDAVVTEAAPHPTPSLTLPGSRV